MRVAMIGLGRMGGNMARRLCRAGIEVVGYNRSPEPAQRLAAEESGFIAASTLDEVVERLDPPRILWLMVPAGEATEQILDALSARAASDDVVVDGGNANYRDSMRRAGRLRESGLHLIDAGVSGGVWGLDNGYCLMVGGEREAVARIEPLLVALAPARDRGWAHVGPAGSGHFTKMIHNGIEYGMMQAMAEGFALLEGKREFDLDLGQVAELWRHGSVVRSWLLDLTADVLAERGDLTDVEPYVADSGEGRWSAEEAIRQGVPAPVMAQALFARFASQGRADYANRLLAMMRHAFGGHEIKG